MATIVISPSESPRLVSGRLDYRKRGSIIANRRFLSQIRTKYGYGEQEKRESPVLFERHGEYGRSKPYIWGAEVGHRICLIAM